MSTTYDNWRFVSNLGSGGYGIVQLWENTHTRKKVAIKICKEDNTNLTKRQKERWIEEVDKLKHIQHPNIIKTEDVPYDVQSKINKNQILPVLCMEYCKKGDLRKVLNNVENCCGMKESSAIQAMLDISCAIEFLHSQRITHRDLKPENIVLQDVNGKIVYKLIDLGYAKDLGENSIYASLVGTLNYVAPELLWDKKYSRSVDYWSLGILFYEIICGRRPFLPKMQHTLTWMKHIKDKSDNEIRAYELNGVVIFETDIEEPTNLSNCMKTKLTDWFKVSLQIDPRKRGKDPEGIHDGSDKPRVIIFDLLRTILLKKVLYVFCLSLYKMFTYEVDNFTIISDIKQQIAKDTCIPVNKQILTDNKGEILNCNNEQLLAFTVDPCCFVFDSDNILMQGNPSSQILHTIQGLINQTTVQSNIDFDEVKDHYRTLIFLLQKEVDLFKYCIFALSIRVDLVDARIQSFKVNVQRDLCSTRQVVMESRNIKDHLKNIPQNSVEWNTFEGLSTKIENLNVVADKMEKNFNDLEQRNEKLKNDTRNIDGISQLTELYDESATNFKEFLENCKRLKRITPGKIVQTVNKFLKVQQAKLFCENIHNILRYQSLNILYHLYPCTRCETKQINELESEISKFEQVFSSLVAMTPVYGKKLLDVKSAKENVIRELNDDQHLPTSHIKSIDSMTVVDNIVYDNLVIRHTIDRLTEELQKRYFEALNFNP